MYDCQCVRISEESLVQNGIPYNWLPDGLRQQVVVPGVSQVPVHSRPPEYVCSGCRKDVLLRKGPIFNVFECDCAMVNEGGQKPNTWSLKPGSDWFASTPASPAPADPSKCAKCAKPLETMGLNRTYPPKRDDMGRAICPHCTTVQPGGIDGGPYHGLSSDSAMNAIRANIDRLAAEIEARIFSFGRLPFVYDDNDHTVRSYEPPPAPPCPPGQKMHTLPSQGKADDFVCGCHAHVDENGTVTMNPDLGIIEEDEDWDD